MKRILAFGTMFVVAFAVTAGAILFFGTPAQANKVPPGCLYELPCDFDDIYCTGTPCDPPGVCHPDRGAIFYCFPDFVTEYCSGDWYYPVPCSHIM